MSITQAGKQTQMQAGILLEGQAFGFSGEWQLKASASEAIEVLAALELDDTVIGIGQPFLTACHASVEGLLPFRARVGAHAMPSTQTALWCFVTASTMSILADRVRLLYRALSATFTLVTSVNMFRYRDGRELSGHIDGTANKTGPDMVKITSIAEGPLQHGSFVLVQRYVYSDATLAHMTAQQKDLTFGRREDSNEEIENAPASAHIHRTDQDTPDGGGDIIRRAMPFSTAETYGTQFIAYTNDLTRTEIKLDRMTGLVDGVTDALLNFAHAETGAYYVCPAMIDNHLALDFLNRRNSP